MRYKRRVGAWDMSWDDVPKHTGSSKRMKTEKRTCLHSLLQRDERRRQPASGDAAKLRTAATVARRCIWSWSWAGGAALPLVFFRRNGTWRPNTVLKWALAQTLQPKRNLAYFFLIHQGENRKEAHKKHSRLRPPLRGSPRLTCRRWHPMRRTTAPCYYKLT